MWFCLPVHSWSFFEAIRARFTLKLKRLLSFMSGNAFLSKDLHLDRGWPHNMPLSNNMYLFFIQSPQFISVCKRQFYQAYLYVKQEVLLKRKASPTTTFCFCFYCSWYTCEYGAVSFYGACMYYVCILFLFFIQKTSPHILSVRAIIMMVTVFL